jgi:hypothetical protein
MIQKDKTRDIGSWQTTGDGKLIMKLTNNLGTIVRLDGSYWRGPLDGGSP